MFDDWAQAAAEVQPNTAMIFVPPRFAADAILEAAAAGVELVIAITEGIPAHDELRVYNMLKRDLPGTRLIGPNCPGILSPGKANVGHHPGLLLQGRQRRRGLALGHADLPDRQRDRPGRLRLQLDRRHRRRPRTGLLVRGRARAVRGRRRDRAGRALGRDRRLGRGGGRRLHRRAHDQAGRRLHRRLHRTRGQADGPRRERSSPARAGTAAAKAQALEAKGVRVGRTPTEAAAIAVEVLGGASVGAA